MDRLTKNNYVDDCFALQNERNQLPEYKSNHYTQSQYNVDLWHKVKEVEDIDEKLGLPYSIFFEAYFNGVYYLDDSGQIIKTTVGIYDLYLTERKKIAFITQYGDKILLFENHGKTWALTREELKDDK